MDADIEMCYADSNSSQNEEINLDLISRYYQILSNQIESGAGKVFEWIQ